MNNPRSRAWTFTINNPTTLDTELLTTWFDQKPKPQYLLYAHEIGEQGTPHYQGYAYFKNPIRWRSLNNYIARAYFKPAKGTTEQNKSYIQGPYEKNGKVKPFNPDAIELGDEPKKSGTRTDLQRIHDNVCDGATMRDLIPNATSYQSIRMAEVSLKYFEPKRDFMTKLYWFYGATGTGKTTTALEVCIDPYVCMETSKWWEGYDAHEDIIIDDYRRDFCKFHELLRLVNQTPHLIEYKGGTRQFVGRRIFITTPKSIEDTWEGRTPEDIEQLKRRCVEEIYFSKPQANIKSTLVINGLLKEKDCQKNIQEEC